MAGKVALITGAASGMGAATCILFSGKGYRVGMIDVNTDRLKSTAQACIKNGASPDDVLTLPCDVRDATAISDSVKKTITAFEKIDVLVNCAGVGRAGTVLTSTMDDYFVQMDINCTGVVRMCREVAPYLIKTQGSIVNIASAWQDQAHAYAAFYCMSKSAVMSLTKCLSNELGPQGVRVNAINPGTTKTHLYESAGHSKEDYEKELEQWIELQPLKIQGMPMDMANAIDFLVSDNARFITGVGFYVDGGITNVPVAPSYDD